MYEEHNKLAEEIKDLKEKDRNEKIEKWLSKEEITEQKNELNGYIEQIKQGIDKSSECQENEQTQQ